MKIITLGIATFLLLPFCFCQQKNKVYDLKFRDIYRMPVHIEEYTGKQILVATFSATNLDSSFLIALESLNKQKLGMLKIIAVPVNGSDSTKAILKNILNYNLHLSFTVTDIGKDSKKDSISQHVLLSWLTHRSFNNHFDADIDEVGQIFLISTKGELYASLKKKDLFDSNFMTQLLNKQP